MFGRPLYEGNRWARAQSGRLSCSELKRIAYWHPIPPLAVKCSFRQGRLTIGRRISSCPTSSAEFLDIRRSEPRLHGTMIPPVGEDQISLWVEYDKGTPVDSRPRGDDRLVYYLPWMNRRPWTASLP